MMNFRDKSDYGLHRYTRGPQVIVDNKTGEIVARAHTLTAARRVRRPGQSIRWAGMALGKVAA